jgi:hypothetical protein
MQWFRRVLWEVCDDSPSIYSVLHENGYGFIATLMMEH